MEYLPWTMFHVRDHVCNMYGLHKKGMFCVPYRCWCANLCIKGVCFNHGWDYGTKRPPIHSLFQSLTLHKIHLQCNPSLKRSFMTHNYMKIGNSTKSRRDPGKEGLVHESTYFSYFSYFTWCDVWCVYFFLDREYWFCLSLAENNISCESTQLWDIKGWLRKD